MIQYSKEYQQFQQRMLIQKRMAESDEDKIRFKQKRFNYFSKKSEKFRLYENGNQLCELFKTNFATIQNLLNDPVYKEYSIPKKKGGRRIIHAPEQRLLQIQKKINLHLQYIYLTVKPANVHGFTLNDVNKNYQANIVENAKIHVGKKAVLNIDLENFFPSIAANRIKVAFQNPPFQYNEQMATTLALLTTYQGKLPQGAPTSPVLSNFVCMELDKALVDWAEINQINYSRYADDLTFSADEFISLEKQQEIRSMIVSQKFLVNEKKFRQHTSNRKQTVTGITVNSKVNVDRKFLKKVRAMLFDLRVNGLGIAAQNHFKLKEKPTTKQYFQFVNRLAGNIAFIGQVRGKTDPIYLKMIEVFEAHKPILN